LQGTVKNILR